MESYLAKTIYKLFPQQFNKIVFEKKHEGSDWKSKCELSFVDDSGVKYFKYKSDFQLPIQRMAYVDTLKLQYMQSWSKNEQNLFDDKLSELFDDLEQDKGLKFYYKKLATLKSLLDEKDLRRESIIQVDILTEMVACLLIREDEDPTEVNEKTLSEKVGVFKKKINYKFLKEQSILTFLGLQDVSPEQYSQLFQISQEYQSKKMARLKSITKE